MSRLIIAIAAIGLLFGVMHAPVTEAANVSCAGASTTQNYDTGSAYYLISIGSGQQWITAVCVQTSAGTVSVTNTGTTSIIGGCYYVYKSQRVAVVGIDANYNSSCAKITKVSINSVKAIGGQR